jgi:hypothetical protein
MSRVSFLYYRFETVIGRFLAFFILYLTTHPVMGLIEFSMRPDDVILALFDFVE